MHRFSITIVSNLYSPDELGGAALITDLASYFSEVGFRVNVVATFPYYPQWKLRDSDRGLLQRMDVVDGIQVHRVKMHVPKQASTGGRMLADLSLFFSLLAFGRKSWKRSDLVITACPMMGQMLALRVSDPFRRQQKLAIVQDFVVDAAIELNMVKGLGVGAFFRGLERWIFNGFDTLSTISDEMHQKLRGMIPEHKRTLFIPNWIHKSLQSAIDLASENAPRRREQVLFYSGNVGRKQGLPYFIESFSGPDSGWTLEINGGGAELGRLATACAGRSDVVLGSVQDEAHYIQSLLSCSACLITQMPGVGANFLPSKILPALASGTPILAICEKGSPLGREVTEAQCGEVIEPHDNASLLETLKRWKSNPGLLMSYGENAKKWSVRYHRETILARFKDEVDSMLETATNGTPPRQLPSRPPFRHTSLTK